MEILDCRKEMTAHLRARIAASGIKARVRMAPGAYSKSIQVFPPAYEIEFTHDEQRTIRTIAKSNKLTFVCGIEIDIERMTDPHGMEFHLSDEGRADWTRNALRFPNPHLREDVQRAAFDSTGKRR